LLSFNKFSYLSRTCCGFFVPAKKLRVDPM